MLVYGKKEGRRKVRWEYLQRNNAACSQSMSIQGRRKKGEKREGDERKGGREKHVAATKYR